MKPPATGAGKEPSTKFGQFYRAHRPEVLAAGGIVVALAAWWKSKHPSSASSSATSSQIDPATGYPAGSAEDQAALAAANGAGTVSAGYGADTGSGGSTGYSGAGYAGDGGNGSSILDALTGIQGTLTTDQTLLQGLQPGTGTTPANPIVVSPEMATPGRTLSQAEKLTEANLAKDKALERKSPSAKNKAAVKNLTTRLGKEKATV